MKKKRFPFASGRVLGMLVKNVLLVEFICLVIVTAVIFMAYRPYLQQKALDESVAAGQALSTQINITMGSVSGYSDFYVYSDGLRRALSSYARSPGDTTYRDVCDILARMQPSGNVSLRSVFLLRGDTLFTSETGLLAGDESMLAADWFESFRQDVPQTVFTPFYSSANDGKDDSMMCLRLFEMRGETYVLGLVCPIEGFVANIRLLAEGLFSGYALATREGPLFFSSGDISGGGDLLRRRALDGSFSDRDKTGYYIVNTTAGDWKVLGFLSNAALDARFTPVLIAALLMCLLVCGLTLLMTIPIAARIITPVDELRDVMQRASLGDMDARADIAADTEIGQLGGYFNEMMDEISGARQKERESDRREQRMRYRLLSSQINAHYIYNTMSSINSLARMGRSEDVITVNSALIRILQSNLRLNDENPFATVKEELGTVEDYWRIESIRPNNHARLTIAADADVQNALILKNILQPLLENSLRHGLTDEQTGSMRGEIRLCVARDGVTLLITVEDDGNGIAPEELERLNRPEKAEPLSGQHIGLANIRKRLALAFDEKAAMTISSGEITRVSIRCPFQTDAKG